MNNYIPNQELIKDLNYFDIINLARTSTNYINLLSDRNMWLYLIERDLDLNKFPRSFIQTFIINGKLDPKEFYEFNYFAGNVKYEDMYTPISTIKYPNNFANVYDKLFLKKLQQFADQQPIDEQTCIAYDILYAKRSSTANFQVNSVISGKNIDDICLKYLTNILSGSVYQYITNLYKGKYDGDNPFSNSNIYTFDDLFDQLPSKLNIQRIDNLRHY